MSFVVGTSVPAAMTTVAAGATYSFPVPQMLASSNLAEGRGARYMHAKVIDPTSVQGFANGAATGKFIMYATNRVATANDPALMPDDIFTVKPNAEFISIYNASGVSIVIAMQFGRQP